MTKGPLKQHRILGVKVNNTTEAEVLDFVLSGLKNKKKFFISTPNPEIIVAAQSDPELFSALNYADIALPDGIGLRLSANFNKRIAGRRMFELLLLEAERQKLKLYLLGGSPEVNKKALLKIKSLFPRIKAKGSGDIAINKEGYSVANKDIKRHIVILKDINKFGPDILFVAFGFPKQEKWVYHNLNKLNIGGAMVVGGAFDYFVGKMTKPPGWVARLGLEWLWRVVLEPKRLPRIFNAVVVFPLLVLREKLAQR